MMLGPLHVLGCVTGIRERILYNAEFGRINVIGTDANTSAARGGGYKLYLTQMSGKEYTAPPKHNAACLTSCFAKQRAGSAFDAQMAPLDGSQVPLMGPGCYFTSLQVAFHRGYEMNLNLEWTPHIN